MSFREQNQNVFVALYHISLGLDSCLGGGSIFSNEILHLHSKK